MKGSPPLLITLEFARVNQVGDPYAFAAEPQEYLMRSEGGGFESMRLEWGEQLLSDLTALRLPGANPEIGQRVGGVLRRFLEPVGWAEHEARILSAQREGRLVLITLRFAAAELYALPWELCTLKASGQHLGALSGVLLRYEWPQTATTPSTLQPTDEGALLFAWSAAAGAVPAAEQLSAIEAACTAGQLSFDRQRDVLQHASCAGLTAALERAKSAGRPITILHILCHGAVAGSTFGLALSGDDPQTELTVVDPGRLRQLLAPHATTLRLVVLSACDSGNSGELGTQLGSVAQALHRAGLAAVVASRYPLSVTGSIRLTETLYRSLLDGLKSLEDALLDVRVRLAQDASRTDWASLQLYARAEDGADSRPIAFRPYRGLLSFQAGHARFFFGRERQVGEICADLAALSQAGRPRLLIVAGASGSGKSSLVLAGAVPRLMRETAGLRLALLRPGGAPEAALFQALSAAGRAATFDSPILVVVDQLEEVFTHSTDVAVRKRFVQRLYDLAAEPRSFVSVIATLRVDFIGRCAELPIDAAGTRLDTIAYDEAHRVFVSQLDAAALLAAIVEPARRVGLELDAGLPQRMLAELGGEPGALPLLEDTLDILWQRRSGRLLTQAAYEAVGGVGGALPGRADAIIAQMDAESQQIARRLLPRLVNLADNPAQSTRRRVLLSELRTHEEKAAAPFDRVVAELAQARLLVVAVEGQAQTIEVAHEALIRKWPRLLGWLNEDRHLLADLEKLDGWVLQWKEMGTMLVGLQLAHAEALQRHLKDGFPESARPLLAASQAHTRRNRRLRRGALGLVIFASLMLALIGGIGVYLGEQARQGARAARDAARMSAVRELSNPRERVAMLREVETEEPDSLPGWIDVATTILRDRASLDWDVDLGDQQRVGQDPRLRISADCNHVISLDRKHRAHVWRRDGQAAVLELPGADGGTNILAVSPDGDRFITSFGEDGAMLWRTGGGEAPRRLSGHSRSVIAAAFSPNGKRFATASARETWIWSSGDETSLRIENADGVRKLVFSPDSRQLATLSMGRQVHVWEQADKPLWFRGSLTPILDVAFSPNGRRILTLHPFQEVEVASLVDLSGGPLRRDESEADVAENPSDSVLWAMATPAQGEDQGLLRLIDPDRSRLLLLSARTISLQSAVLCSDRERVASIDYPARVQVWRVGASLAEVGLRILSKDGVTSARYSPDGRLLATVHTDRKVRLWSGDGLGAPVVSIEASVDIGPIVWSAATNRLLAISADGDVHIRNLDVPDAGAHLTGKFDAFSLPAFSPDGQAVVLPLRDGNVQVRRSDGTGEPTVVPGKGRVKSVFFTPAGDRFVTVGENGLVRVFSSDGKRHILTIPHQPLGPTQDNTICSPYACLVPGSGMLFTASGCAGGRLWRSDGLGTPVLFRGSPSTYAVACSPAGQHVALGRGPIELWNADGSGTPLRLGPYPQRVQSLTFSADGKFLISTAMGEPARLQPSDGSAPPIALLGQVGGVDSVALHPSGKRVVTVGKFHSAWLRDIEHREQARPSELRRRLWQLQAYCPGDQFRREHLYETQDDAHFAMRSCDTMLECLKNPTRRRDLDYASCLAEFRIRQDDPWRRRLYVFGWLHDLMNRLQMRQRLVPERGVK